MSGAGLKTPVSDGGNGQGEFTINGVTIKQERCEHVEYWHIELDAHDLILAEEDGRSLMPPKG